MRKKKYGIIEYNHPEKSHVRNLWIANSWHTTGCGAHRNKKRDIPRRQKYKNLPAD